MLVLSRKPTQRVVIDTGDATIVVTVIRAEGRNVRLGFEAEPHVSIQREEVHRDIARNGRRKTDPRVTNGDRRQVLMR